MPKIYIDENLCKKCDLCAEFCLQQVFGKKAKIINADKCNKCGNCQLLCPERAIILTKPRGGPEKRKNREQTETAFLTGNDACGQAALDVGCSFFAGYPITPATEIMYKMMELKKSGGFAQMEDEIASIHAVIGASIAGKKAMTATSGPGLDLMQEGLGLAVSLEIPCVVMVMQRAGPSTGQATRPSQADLLPAIFGSHGDAPRVVLTPSNAQDCYYSTIEAFNLAEKYRVPVIVLLDELLAHTYEKIALPDEITVFNRVYRPGEDIFGEPASGDQAASMPNPEDGENFTYTGSTHLFDGNRSASSPEAQQRLNNHLSAKMEKINFLIPNIKRTNVSEKNKIIFISFGTAARSVREAIIRKDSCEAGLVEIKRMWPFGKKYFEVLKNIARKDCEIAVVEMNQGQLIHLVKETFPGAKSLTQNNGLVIEPKRIEKYIEKGEW